MTREEAIIELKRKITCTIGGLSKEEYNATVMAIEALQADAEQEAVPTVVRVTMSDGKQYYLEHERDAIQADAVQGEWIFNPTDAIDLMFAKPKCSKCGFESSDGGNYCPNCGARMKGGAE